MKGACLWGMVHSISSTGWTAGSSQWGSSISSHPVCPRSTSTTTQTTTFSVWEPTLLSGNLYSDTLKVLTINLSVYDTTPTNGHCYESHCVWNNSDNVPQLSSLKTHF